MNRMKVVNGSAKQIKISGDKVDFSTFDSSLVTNILIFLPPIDLVNVGLTSQRFGLIQDGRLRLLERSGTSTVSRHIDCG